MDIFSLVSPEQDGNFQQDGEGDGSLASFPEGDDSDGFETPRSQEWTPASTPRSLFSTPPRTPRSPPKTPPRPTSRVDDRIRRRRGKSSTSHSPSPVKSGGLVSGSLEDSPLVSHRISDVFFSSAVEDEDEWGGSNSDPSSPDVTPSFSPSKSDQLSLSPLQQRLARARTKRQQILEERVQNIDNRSKAKGEQAIRRKEDATLEKVIKARKKEFIVQAKSKREQILEERVQQIEVKSKLKEKEALKRKEDATLEVIEKARSELAKSPIAKERRDQQLALRVEELEAWLESKTQMARRRLERHLLQKQQRASCKERKERAERRRTLISYEKRARLLAGLDAKLERAALSSQRFVEEKAIRSGGEVVKAKEVARRVKAARAIQGAIREAYGLEHPDMNGKPTLGQHEAAGRLQRWPSWRVRVCRRRFLARDDADDDHDNEDQGDGAKSVPKAIEALEKLLKLFSVAPEGRQQRRPSVSPPFEELGRRMMQPETLEAAARVVDCLRPINEVSFGPSGGDGAAASGSSRAGSGLPGMDGRTLLSLSLIAVHPHEVLGDDFDETTGGEDDRAGRGSRLLALTCKSLLSSLRDLLVSTKDPAEPGNFTCSSALSLCLQATTLFVWWKGMDMERLLAGLRTQLEQSWVVYLSSSDTLKYLAEVTGVDVNGPGQGAGGAKRDDPLMSLRLRHEAGRSGSRSHIKRIRLSLNRLVGSEDGRKIVKEAKTVALREIRESDAMRNLKGEIDEIHGGLGPTVRSTGPEENAVAGGTGGAAEELNRGRRAVPSQGLATSANLPHELLSNRILVHKILLDKLSWEGTNAQASNVSPGEFMASFTLQTAKEGDSASTENMPMCIAQSMRMAFFDGIAQEMSRGNYEPIRELLKELHAKMRSLLPSREDLHSHLNEEDVASFSSTGDVLRGLVRAGNLLANYLESAARAPATREIVERVESFNLRNGDAPAVPYGVRSEDLFTVASVAYVLHKAELCQMDVSNYRLSRATPLLHLMGHEYERKHFREAHGDYTSSSIKELQRTLPSTWSWVERTRVLLGDGENLTPQSSPEQKMDFMKGRGFVDGILFMKSRAALPEVLSLDVESINRIRQEARCCVIASALALHACNISRVGTSVLSSSVMPDEVQNAKQALASVLRRKHFEQTELESSVIEATCALAMALADRDFAAEELIMLKNHTLAVLRGNDPVLKLLDNRVQSFFRFACKWKPDGASSGTVEPLEMKTGRSIIKTDDSAATRHGIKSTREEFSLAATKEALRLGFYFFGSGLIRAGDEARKIISLTCLNYGEDILDRFLGVAPQGNSIKRG